MPLVPPGVQAHQEVPLYQFLVQLAVHAIQVTGTEPGTEAAWCQALLALTEGDPDPWCLVVQDRSKPAFMQPPVMANQWAQFKTVFSTPDDVDAPRCD